MITGNYPLDNIKYFSPDGARLNVKCPHCGAELSEDISDGMIEYPQANDTVILQCDCGEDVYIRLKIVLKYEIEVAKVE